MWSLTANAMTVNSVGFNKSIFKTCLKNDHEVKNREPANDGLFSQLFPADAPPDHATLAWEFNLLKQVIPNGEHISILCMIGYTRTNYGNLWSVFKMLVAKLTPKEAELIMDRETTGKLKANAKPRTSLQYLVATLYETYQVELF